MHDMEKVIKGLELCTNISQDGCLMLCPYKDEKDETYSLFCEQVLKQDVLSLLKEQESKERKWLQTIADNQIANAPKDSPMSLDEQLESEYKSGIYDGLQMAFEILTEGR